MNTSRTTSIITFLNLINFQAPFFTENSYSQLHIVQLLLTSNTHRVHTFSFWIKWCWRHIALDQGPVLHLRAPWVAPFPKLGSLEDNFRASTVWKERESSLSSPLCFYVFLSSSRQRLGGNFPVGGAQFSNYPSKHHMNSSVSEDCMSANV